MKKKFSWRAFISFGLFVSLFILFFSGLMLYLAPSGRIAHWVNWKIIGLDKNQWQALHTLFSFFFIVLSVIHLFSINWKAFWSYIRSKSQQGLNRTGELLAAMALTIIILTGTLLDVTPFSSVMHFADFMTEKWEENIDRPPVPHAEKLSLAELADQLDNYDVNTIINRLHDKNIRFDTLTQTLQQLGEINDMAPVEIYNIIVNSSAPASCSAMAMKSLEAFAAEAELSLDILETHLRNKGIEAERDQTLIEIAYANGITVKDICMHIIGFKKGH